MSGRGGSISSDGGDSDEEEPWDQSGDEASSKGSNVNKDNKPMRGTAVNEISELPALNISGDEEDGMVNMSRNNIKNNGSSTRKLTSGQRTMRPLSPPAMAGMPGHVQDRDDVESGDDDDFSGDDDEDDMPMDERMDYQRRIAEALCIEDAGEEAVDSANLCAYTLSKMGDLCIGGKSIDSPERRTIDGQDRPNRRLSTNGKQDVPEGVDELTAIEVEYVEPVGKPSKKVGQSPPAGRLSPTPDSPTRKKGRIFSGDPYKERDDTAKSPGRNRDDSTTATARSPKRKSALLSAMTKRAKEDYEKGKPQTSSSGATSGEDSPAFDQGYSSFNQIEKRKFLKLINSGLTPSEATAKVVEERQSGEAAMEHVGEGSSSKNSKGRLAFWKNQKKEDDAVPKEIMQEDELMSAAPMTPKSENPALTSVGNGESDDVRFAKSGIGYYDADRKDQGDSMEIEDEEELASAARRGSNKKKSFLPKFVRKGFTPMDKDGKPVEKKSRGSRLAAIGGSLRGTLSPTKLESPEHDSNPAIDSPPRRDRSTSRSASSQDVAGLGLPTLLPAPQQSLSSESRSLPEDPPASESGSIPRHPPAYSGSDKPEESKSSSVFRPISLKAQTDQGVPLTQTYSDESLLNDEHLSIGEQVHEEKKEDVSAASSLAGSAEIEDVITAQLLGTTDNRPMDTANSRSLLGELKDEHADMDEPDIDMVPPLPEKPEKNMELDDVDLEDVDMYFSSTELMSTLNGANSQDHMSVVSSKSQKTSATGRTGLSYATNHTTSSRKRHHGAASRRLAAAKTAQQNQGKKTGWQESIKAAAANTNRQWDPQKGWVDYVDPNAVVEKGEDGVVSPEDKIHIPLDRLTKAQSKEEQSEEQNVALQSTQELDRAMVAASMPSGIEQEKRVVEVAQDSPKEAAETPPEVAQKLDPGLAEQGSHKHPDESSQNQSSALRSVPIPSTPPRGQKRSEMISSPKRVSQVRRPPSRNSKTPPRARGWVESMKAATANLATSGKRWDPERGWVGMDDADDEDGSAQDRYNASLSVQADSDTQDFGMGVTTPAREQNLGHGQGQGMNAAIVTPTSSQEKSVPAYNMQPEHSAEAVAVSRSVPVTPPEVELKAEQSVLTPDATLKSEEATMSVKDDNSVDSTDQSRGASIRSGRSGRYVQIGDTGSVRSHYRNPRQVNKKPQETKIIGGVIEEHTEVEKGNRATQPGTVNVVKEKVSPEDAGLFPKSERSSGPIDLDDLYEEEQGSFDAPPDFSWDQEGSGSQAGVSPDNDPAQSARQANPVPKIRINVRDTNKANQDHQLASKSTDSQSVGVQSSTGKPIPKLRGPKRDTSPIRARKTRTSGSKPPEQSAELVPIASRQHLERLPSQAKQEKSPPLVPTRRSVESHTDVDTSFESDGTPITPMQHFSSDSGEGANDDGAFPILSRSNLEREHFQHISPPSSPEEGDYETSKYSTLPPQGSMRRQEQSYGGQASNVFRNQAMRGPPRPEGYTEHRSVPADSNPNAWSQVDRERQQPTTQLSPMQGQVTSAKSVDSTDSRRSSVKLVAQFWESQGKPPESPNMKKDDTHRVPPVASGWNSFLAKKVKAESEAVILQQQRSRRGVDEDRDSLFDFPESEGAFPTAGRPEKGPASGSANARQAPGFGGEPEAAAFRDISDLSPIRVQHEDDDAERFSETSSAAVQPSTSSTFLQRLQACAAPIVPRSSSNNDDANCNAVPLAHLAFLRTNPSLNGTPEKQRSSRFAPPNLCGKPDVIVEEDEEEDLDTSNEKSRDRSEQQIRPTRSGSNQRQSKQSDVGSVISEEAFGAKTAYLDAIAMKTAVSGSKKKKKRSAGSDVSVSSRHSEKWQRFLESKGSKSSVSEQADSNKTDDVSRAAEKYAAEKVEEMMEIMAQRNKPPGFQGRPMEEATGAFPSVGNSTATDTTTGSRKNEASRAAEDLAAARVEAMMNAMSNQNNVSLEEGEI